MAIADNINELLILHNMKPADLAKKSEVSQPRIHEIVNGITKNPRMETLKKISEAFGVTVDDLTASNPSYKPQHVTYESTGSIAVSGKSEITINRPEGAFDIPRSTRKIPVISWAQAGADGFFEDCHAVGFGYAEISCPYDVTDQNAYALMINGESMYPKFEQGDIVIVSPSAEAQTGDCAIVRLKDGQVMAKKIKNKNSHYVLVSLNPDYEDIVCEPQEIRFIHKIVWIKPRG